jgi:FtsX-like permease family
VSMASNPPLGNRWSFARTAVAGRTIDVHFNHVDPPFFQTMHIPLLRGRNLMPGDSNAIIVSESLARLQWPAEDPLGKSFRTGTSGPTFNVVGVVGSARLVSPEDSDAVEIYQLPDASILPAMVVLVRTSAPSEGLISAVASVAKSIDPQLFPEVQLMRTSFQAKVRSAEYTALAVSLLGFVALLLACVGVIGLVAYAVSQRTKEIGIRMALGAKPSHILSVVLREFSRPVIVGLLAGIGGAAALSQILRRLLYGVSNLDPIAYLAAIAVFVVTVALAALWPARRALSVDPMRALRQD